MVDVDDNDNCIKMLDAMLPFIFSIGQINNINALWICIFSTASNCFPTSYSNEESQLPSQVGSSTNILILQMRNVRLKTLLQGTRLVGIAAAAKTRNWSLLFYLPLLHRKHLQVLQNSQWREIIYFSRSTRGQETVLESLSSSCDTSGRGLHPGAQRESQTPFTDVIQAPGWGTGEDFLSSLCLLPAVHQEVLHELAPDSPSSPCYPSGTLASFLLLKYHKPSPASAHGPLSA